MGGCYIIMPSNFNDGGYSALSRAFVIVWGMRRSIVVFPSHTNDEFVGICD